VASNGTVQVKTWSPNGLAAVANLPCNPLEAVNSGFRPSPRPLISRAMVDHSRTAINYRYECWRALSAGVIEAAGTIFLLLIAVRWFKAGPLAKAMIAGGGSVGLILAPWVVSRVEASGWPVAKAAARLAALGAGSFLVMALVPVLHGDAEISYRKHDGKTFQVRSGRTLIIPSGQFAAFCADPPEWFRGEY